MVSLFVIFKCQVYTRSLIMVMVMGMIKGEGGGGGERESDDDDDDEDVVVVDDDDDDTLLHNDKNLNTVRFISTQ